MKKNELGKGEIKLSAESTSSFYYGSSALIFVYLFFLALAICNGWIGIVLFIVILLIGFYFNETVTWNSTISEMITIINETPTSEDNETNKEELNSTNEEE